MEQVGTDNVTLFFRPNSVPYNKGSKFSFDERGLCFDGYAVESATTLAADVNNVSPDGVPFKDRSERWATAQLALSGACVTPAAGPANTNSSGTMRRRLRNALRIGAVGSDLPHAIEQIEARVRPVWYAKQAAVPGQVPMPPVQWPYLTLLDLAAEAEEDPQIFLQLHFPHAGGEGFRVMGRFSRPSEDALKGLVRGTVGLTMHSTQHLNIIHTDDVHTRHSAVQYGYEMLQKLNANDEDKANFDGAHFVMELLSRGETAVAVLDDRLEDGARSKLGVILRQLRESTQLTIVDLPVPARAGEPERIVTYIGREGHIRKRIAGTSLGVAT